MAFDQYDNNLKKLAEDITKAIKLNKDGSSQKDQVEKLMLLEEKFKKSIIRFAQSREVYRQFILTIVVSNKNILSARPYFREKSKVFSSKITPAIKNGDIQTLQKFAINFNLIKFIRDSWKGGLPEKSENLYQEIIHTRNKLIENNMPLAINRAKLFFRKVPKNHLSLNDLIGIAATGLISGIDKYAGAYSRVFNGVCIGRMTGNMIDEYSETTIHFYPSDRSKLYRANSLRFRYGIEDTDKLVEIINNSYAEDKANGIKTPKTKMTKSELSRLLNASSTLSLEQKKEAPELFEGDPALKGSSITPEDELIRKSLMGRMLRAIKKLNLIEQKILKLKGVRV